MADPISFKRPIDQWRANGAWRSWALAGAVPLALLAIGEFATRMLIAQQMPSVAAFVRGLAGVVAIGAVVRSVCGIATHASLAAAASEMAVLVGGGLLAEVAARGISPMVGGVLQMTASIIAVWWMYRIFKAAPQYRFAATALVGVLASAAVVLFAWRREWFGIAYGVSGITVMACGFLLGLSAVRRLLAASTPVTAVARTMLDEAIRMRVGLVLLVLLLVSLPLLPLLLDPTERLEYRLQFLISWALGGSGFILGLLTVLLACGSICGDIDSNRIHMTLTKPVTRGEFLLGKWLGITVLNVLLVALCSAGVYTCVQILARSPADASDREAIHSRVLTARKSVLPRHPRGADFERDLEREITRIREQNPDFFLSANGDFQRGRIRHELIWQWHTITPDRQGEYVFDGLQRAKQAGKTFQLQLKPFADNVTIDRADVSFAIWLNDRPFPVGRGGQHLSYTLASRTLHTITLPTSEIDEQGSLRLRIANRNAVPPGEKVATSINFSPGQGLQVLYSVGSFESNYLRNVVEMWLKLVTIAAIGVAVATGLGFPVASLLGLMMFIAAIGSGYLGGAVDYYTGLDAGDATVTAMLRLRTGVFRNFVGQGEYWEAAKVVMAVFGDTFLSLVPSFARFDGVTRVATGMQIDLPNVAECAARLGIFGPAVLGFIGWIIFERRDLVRANS